MIDTLHSSVLHGVLGELAPADSVRLASCSKYLYQSIMISASHATLIPILRERLKEACWSLLQAGYCVEVRNTLAYHISSAKSMITFTYYEDLDRGYYREIIVNNNDRKTFGEVFDRYIIHANARLQRCKRGNIYTIIRVKKIEKHFARCTEQLSRVATCAAVICTCSICRPIVPSHIP
jgi:hypothetical protein